MMRNNATEEFKMKCRADLHGAREKLGHYADLRNGGLMPDANKAPAWMPMALVGAVLAVAGIILALIF